MRSFIGRDILSLRDFERAEFFRIFDVCRFLGLRCVCICQLLYRTQ